MLSDRGYDAYWFREGLIDKGIRPCIPGRKSRKTTIKYDKRRYKRRNRIERMFGRIKDWRRVAPRYDRRPNGLPRRHHAHCNRYILVMNSEPRKLGAPQPPRRHSSAMLSSPRRPSSTILIFSPGLLRVPVVCLIFRSSVVMVSQEHSLSNLTSHDPVYGIKFLSMLLLTLII